MGTEGRRKLMFIVNTKHRTDKISSEKTLESTTGLSSTVNILVFIWNMDLSNTVWKPSVYSSTQVRSFVQLVQKMNWWENNHRNQHNCFLFLPVMKHVNFISEVRYINMWLYRNWFTFGKSFKWLLYTLLYTPHINKCSLSNSKFTKFVLFFICNT